LIVASHDIVTNGLSLAMISHKRFFVVGSMIYG